VGHGENHKKNTRPGRGQTIKREIPDKRTFNVKIMKTIMQTVLLIAALSLTSSALHAADTAQADKIFKHLIAAQTAKDYDAFVADANDNLKAALTKTQFDAASNVMNQRTQGGYDLTFLGELNQRGYQVFLYRLRFKDGGDDMLGTMSLKDDKVGGIYFK
jgi:hypothetical protein